MNNTFKAKLLKHLAGKKSEGFTLIELLVVIIIIGILSAIALPAFLNQAAKARQSEAKQTLGALNRGQQSYRTESNQFSPKISYLALGVKESTPNFGFSTNPVAVYAPVVGTDSNRGSFSFMNAGFSASADGANSSTAATNSGAAPVNGGAPSFAYTAGSNNIVFIRGRAIDARAVRDYIGGVLETADVDGNATTTAVMCESKKPISQQNNTLPHIKSNAVNNLNVIQCVGTDDQEVK